MLEFRKAKKNNSLYIRDLNSLIDSMKRNFEKIFLGEVPFCRNT